LSPCSNTRDHALHVTGRARSSAVLVALGRPEAKLDSAKSGFSFDAFPHRSQAGSCSKAVLRGVVRHMSTAWQICYADHEPNGVSGRDLVSFLANLDQDAYGCRTRAELDSLNCDERVREAGCWTRPEKSGNEARLKELGEGMIGMRPNAATTRLTSSEPRYARANRSAGCASRGERA
jgi:hypothetical protein